MSTCGWEESENFIFKLIPPENTNFLLEPCHKPSKLSNAMEHRKIVTLKYMEIRFGTGFITGGLIKSFLSF